MENKECDKDSDGAQLTLSHQTTEQDTSREQQVDDPSSPSAQMGGMLSESKRLKLKKDRKMLKEKKKKKKKGNNYVTEPVEEASIDIKSAIATLAEQMKWMQMQSIQAEDVNKIVPPVLTPEQETLLGNNFVTILEHQSPKHPNAIFQCVICRKFCKSYGMVIDHVNDVLHKQKLQRVKDGMTLKCLPPPTKDQIDHVSRVVDGVLSTYGLKKKELTDRKAVANTLDTLVKQLQPDCGVRMYGSTASGLALRTSDLNLELTVADEKMASKMLCRLADEIEKDKVYRDVERSFTDSEPALKFFVEEFNFKCVIIMQNKHSYKLSKLISDYVGIDERVSPLGIMLRKLAMVKSILYKKMFHVRIMYTVKFRLSNS